MAQKQYFLLTDTETTNPHGEDKITTVADFAAIIVDRKGVIHKQIAVLVSGHFGHFKLFYDKNSSESVWTLAGLKRRNENYRNMLNSGERMLATPAAINKWLQQALTAYPGLIFTAYNAEFDLRQMQNTGISTSGFADIFCLWRASVNKLSKDKRYIEHCINRKWLTAKLNFRTNAEAVAEYAVGHSLPPEPHTALEDCIDYELPILLWLIKNKSYKKYSQNGYNWREWQLHNLVKPS
jgi:hypothetical protein